MFVGNKNDIGEEERKVLHASGEQVSDLPDCIGHNNVVSPYVQQSCLSCMLKVPMK